MFLGKLIPKYMMTMMMTNQHLISLDDPPFDNLKGYIARHFVLLDEKVVESYIDDYSLIFSDQCF